MLIMNENSEANDENLSTARSITSPNFVLPPIISSERDREFLISLNASIDEELTKVKDRYHPEQRFMVYKSAFDQIIDYVAAYKPLLTAIKAEYEDCIEIIRRGQKEAFFLSGKLKAMASEPSTIRNYKKRIDELEQRTSVIRNDNDKLCHELEQLRTTREEIERKQQDVNDPPVREVKRDRRHIPGLTTEESTDLKKLLKEKEKLERQYKELNITHRTRYAPKHTQQDLKEKLASKVQNRDGLIDETEYLKMKQKRLKIAVEAAQAYMKIQPPHQTIGDAVVLALVRQGTASVAADKGDDGMPRGTPSTTFEEDDPTREKEAEMMLEYIEKFNELLEDSKYEEAAIHAANSPKGILRTPESLQRFKDIQHEKTSSGRSPLLAFCDALMSSVLAFGVPPSELLCIESIKVAFHENRLNLISHWISQERVTMTKKLGDLLYQFSSDRPQTGKTCLALAQKVYADAKAHAPAMICMIQQGRVSQALEYGKKNNLVMDDYKNILKKCSSNPALAHGLYLSKCSGKSLLSLGIVVMTLVECGNTALAIHIMEDIQLKATADKSSETPLRQAIFSDDITSAEQWHYIIQKCQDSGYNDLAIDILAALTLQGVIQNASQHANNIDKLNENEIKEDKVKIQNEEKRESVIHNKGNENEQSGVISEQQVIEESQTHVEEKDGTPVVSEKNTPKVGKPDIQEDQSENQEVAHTESAEVAQTKVKSEIQLESLAKSRKPEIEDLGSDQEERC